MQFLREKDRQDLQTRFSTLKDTVRLVFFTQELECQYCRETRQLLSEVVGLSDKIKLEVYNFVTDKPKAEEFAIDKIPATAVMSETNDYGIRHFGIPSGYEFASLLTDIEMVSRGEHGLSQKSLEKLKRVQTPVHIQVFVTPTCPYCPSAVSLGHSLAYVNDNIRADMVEATEFPHLSYKYNVRGVPRVIINETHHFEGALAEEMYVEHVLQVSKPNGQDHSPSVS